MDKSIFIRADELAVELDVSKALAYKMMGINQIRIQRSLTES